MDKTTDRFILNDLLDDLNSYQMTMLLNWLWMNNYKTTRANIRAWRKTQNLSA